MDASTVAATLGQVGLPAPLAELTARSWDVVVVGGGHNGLTAAAYLARAGRSVLVLERRERLGGACTLEQPFDDPGYLVGPCAYVVGLLDQTVIDELAWSATATGCSWPIPTCGCRSPTAPRWPSSSTTTAPWPTCGPTASPSATSRGCSTTRTCSTGCGWPCGPGPRATPGRATRRPASSWRSASATTASWSRCCSRSRSPTPWTARSPTSG